MRRRLQRLPPEEALLSAPSDAPEGRRFLAKARARIGALPAGIFSGALFGALLGGVAGRLVMRLIFLIDDSTDGAKTDFGTVGEITAGGSFTLLVLSVITGAIGGVIYVALRRWLPWSGAARGTFFGLLMMFGPGAIFLGEVDLQIFEPALPILAMFVVLIVLYGVGVALLVDWIAAPRPVQPGPRIERAAVVVQLVLAVAVCFMAVLVTQNVYAKAGSCLTADGDGGCGARTTDGP